MKADYKRANVQMQLKNVMKKLMNTWIARKKTRILNQMFVVAICNSNVWWPLYLQYVIISMFFSLICLFLYFFLNLFDTQFVFRIVNPFIYQFFCFRHSCLQNKQTNPSKTIVVHESNSDTDEPILHKANRYEKHTFSLKIRIRHLLPSFDFENIEISDTVAYCITQYTEVVICQFLITLHDPSVFLNALILHITRGSCRKLLWLDQWLASPKF